jgi:glycosyltransferase involved in cell wall biosynthesis
LDAKGNLAIREKSYRKYSKSSNGLALMYNASMPVLSVLLPCYQAAETLDQALSSLAQQTEQDFEVIAVDDGSSDSSWELIETWAKRDTRIHPIKQPHGGVVKALNVGLEACRADYIARMDADDVCHPERFESQANYLHRHSEVAVVSCLVEAFPEEQVQPGLQIYLDWLNSLVSDADIRREIYIESPLPHPSVMMRRTWVEKAGGYQDRGWPEDYDLWLRLNLAGARFAKVPRVLLKWREHGGRLTHRDRRYSVENFLRAKAHYLARGPLVNRDAVILWGAGMIGRRLSKHLAREGVPVVAFLDIDPQKIGRTLRGLPILASDELPSLWSHNTRPALLAAVGSRLARPLIRARLNSFGLKEGLDWWSVA